MLEGNQDARSERTEKVNQAARELRFEECGIEVKVNRLRDAVISLSVQLEHAGAQASKAARISEAHQHGHNGEVVMPVFEGHGSNLAGMGRDSYEGPLARIRRLLG